ncbi:MAG: hypothetical protein KAR08_11375 [Candidatus Heimdallarchaeota archaeon]|nr:hypothetical protein [Candidatus Heimdallarchaeota archaeon]
MTIDHKQIIADQVNSLRGKKHSGQQRNRKSRSEEKQEAQMAKRLYNIILKQSINYTKLSNKYVV